MMARIPTAAACVFCCLLAASAYPQTTTVSAPPPPPANLAFVEGAVDVVHDGVVERADPPSLLVDGDSVRTAHGRAEVVFADGTLLHLDRDGHLDILAPDRVRLLGGRVIIRVSAAATRAYFVDTPAATVRLDARGEYTVSAVNQAGNDLEVSTTRGSAELDDGSQRVLVRAGESVSLAVPGARVVFRTFNSARWDALAQWANERANGFTAARSSAQLPAELRAYGPVFDQYGRWDTVAPYGQVWLPSVGAAWRPYYEGSWGYTRYGWTWYGRDRWAWPTHHYGRWGFTGASWFWIPTNVWGPAWVSWGSTAGYVSWSPLGFDGLPSIGFWPRRDHPGYRPAYSPWRGWTVVPRDHFRGPPRPIRAHAIDGNRLDDATRRAMNFDRGGPPTPAGLARPPNTIRSYAGNVRRPASVGGSDLPTLDRSGQVRRPPLQPAGGVPSNFAVPRNRVQAPSRPPAVDYIRGGVRSTDGNAPQPASRGTLYDGRNRRPIEETTAERDRRVLTTRPGAPASADQERDRSTRPAYRGAYERPASGDNGRSRGESDRSGSVRSPRSQDSGGSVQSRPAERGGTGPDGGGARARGGSREGGASAGAPAPGARGSGGGGRGGGGGGAVRRPR